MGEWCMHVLQILASMKSFTDAYAQSDFAGKLIIWGLAGLSIVCWITLLYKIWQAQKVKKASFLFGKAIEKHKDHLLTLESSIFPPALPSHIPHPFATIYFVLKNKTIELLNKKAFFLEKTGKPNELYLTPSDIEMLEQHVASTISDQYKILEKNLFLLSTIATLAPFLGLLGTVWGILVTFSGLNSGAAASNSAILGGLSTALSTTVLGLVIAIPALVSYNYLKNNLKHYSSDMESFLYQLISTLELQYRKVDLN
jgi:biopolymer transport protein TolQ